MKSKKLISVAIASILIIGIPSSVESQGLKGLLKGLGNEILKGGKDAGKQVWNDLKNQGSEALDNVISGSKSPVQRLPQRNTRSTDMTKKRQPTTVAPIKSQSTDAGSVNSLMFRTVSMSNMLFRMDSNNQLFIDKQSMSLKGNLGVTISGQAGKRVICMVTPIVNGDVMADSRGECTALYAFTPTSNRYDADVEIAVPYSWLGIGLNDKINEPKGDLGLSVAVLSLADDKVLAQGDFDLVAQNMTLGELNPMEMVGSLFGNSADGDVVHTCSACDGIGLCPYCDGDAFFDPSVCRKCSANPGVCRRCHGIGEEGVEVDDGLGGFGGLFGF